MQASDPVAYYEPLDLFVLTRYDDVRFAGRTPELFSNASGLTLNELRMGQGGIKDAFERFFDPSGELVITLDPPRHRQLKQLLTPAFNPRAVRALEPAIHRITNELLDTITPGEPIEFVDRIAARLPVAVAAAVLGVPGDHFDELAVWVQALEDFTRVETEAELDAAAVKFASMGEFLHENIQRKRREPEDDLISVLLGARLDDAPLPEPVILSHLMTLLSNGGTTRLLLASLADLLGQYPDERQRVVGGGSALRQSALEEALRLAPPARGFVRTLTHDHVLHGQNIRAGQHVYLLYVAANRDAEHFLDPHAFDAGRHQEKLHVAFGYGTHTCLGAALVRLEVDIFLAALLERFPTIERAGDPVRLSHVQLNGWSHLPLIFES
jgi:cytochrome P450